MKNTSFNIGEVELAMNLDNAQLFALLVPPHIKAQSFSKEGLIAKGREIYAAKLKQVKNTVCPVYKSREANVENGMELTVLIGSALLGSPSMADIPVLPMAVLLVKIGLVELCADFK